MELIQIQKEQYVDLSQSRNAKFNFLNHGAAKMIKVLVAALKRSKNCHQIEVYFDDDKLCNDTNSGS